MVIFTADDNAAIVSGDTNGYVDLFRYIPEISAYLQLTFATNGGMAHPSVAADGRTLYFQSDDTTLDGDDSNGVIDIFVTSLP
jgi:Tol biopolymer transport system component